MKYRPEIDGLRAMAVLSVLIYHAKLTLAGVPILTGGYIGVDVFFVISGYLIASIILREVDQGAFSYLSFYERRARRILPALFTVMLVSIPFAWIVLLPNALQEYSASILSSLFFVSNFLFWLQDSYVAAPSELKPFLHTWSLSVEEQFYLLFPVILFLLWRFTPKNILLVFCGLFLASLILAQLGSVYFIDANFFLLPSRGWELMVGAILAQLESKNISILADKYRSILVKSAFVILSASFFVFSEHTAHPSILTLVPVLATAIIIANRDSSDFTVRILSWPIVVFVGLISYSLYLWHFPIFAFARISFEALTNVDKIYLLLFSFVIAIIAYLGVEKPLRNRQKWKPKLLMPLLGIVFVFLVGIQSYFYISGGATQRLGSVEELFSVAQEKKVANGEHNIEGGKLTLINLGDSHAGVLAHSLREVAHNNTVNFVNMSQPGCPLAPGIFRFTDGKFKSFCSDLQKKWMSQVESYKNSIVVYTIRLNLYFRGERFDNQEGGVEPGPITFMTDKRNGKVNVEGLKLKVKETIERLLDIGQKVILVYPIPEVGWNVPNLVRIKLSNVPAEKKLKEFESLSISTSFDVYRERSYHAYDLYDSIDEHENLIRVYPSEHLCSEGENRCYAHNKKRLYYYDDSHLSPFSAQFITDNIKSKILKKDWFR